MFSQTSTTTGIDVGTTMIKLVRCTQDRDGDVEVALADAEAWEGRDRQDRSRRAGETLRDLLARNKLGRRQLGRIATSVGWQENSMRETRLPHLTDKEFAGALRFEAPNHLDLADMEAPVFAGQILDRDAGSEDGTKGFTNALFAAAPASRRDFMLEVLDAAKLEPHVIDLDATAALNAVLADLRERLPEDAAFGVLDLGRYHTSLHISTPRGGLLSRLVGPGAPVDQDADEESGYLMKLTSGVQQTLTFYRGRHRCEVTSIHMAGGGANNPDRVRFLDNAVSADVRLYRPGAHGDEAGLDPMYLTAYGLCRWWDGGDDV